MKQKHIFDEIKYKSKELGFDDFGVTDLKILSLIPLR